ncbi:hypothetical protein [Mycolicibacterium tusciae]|uniref:hypothetical protein n=1 Tax=Mycolicibacterium tusciae TaxID=75922 RepID=UPI000D1D13ED|nr:hypothetical protein [Mycolicibacterium tusciae]
MTISVTKDDGGTGPSPTGETFGLASANDKGPANIITEDPSCAAWTPISQTFVDIQQKGWADRDPAIAEPDWTPALREQYQEVRVAARNVADQSVQLAKLTPHRVMRELYEAYIAYARAYSAAIPTYTPEDNHLAGVMNSAGSVITYVCAAITYKSAQARAPLVDAPPPPAEVEPLSDPSDPSRFLAQGDPTCAEWTQLLERYVDEMRPWQAIDSAIPASNWTVEQRAVIDETIPLMKKYADDIDELGRSSDNPVIQDLAVFSSQYRRAYAAALPTYTSADGWLDSTAHRTTSTIYEACKAAGA